MHMAAMDQCFLCVCVCLSTKASLDQILATIPLQYQPLLEQTVSDIHIAVIVRSLTNWNLACADLWITEAEEEMITEENRSTIGQRYVWLLNSVHVHVLMYHCILDKSVSYIILEYCSSHSIWKKNGEGQCIEFILLEIK